MRRALIAVLLFASVPSFAQSPFNGNTLITPLRSTNTYLIDINQNVIGSWDGANGAGHTVYWLPDNSVIRGQGDPAAPVSGGGGAGGHMQRINSSNVVVWDYFLSTSEYQGHHDIQPMPNGNILAIAWEVKTAAEATADGRTEPMGARLLPTYIVEVQPVGSNDANLVWEWRIWDHIIQDNDPAKPNFGVIADHPELVDIDLGGGGESWDHANWIDYDEQRDLIVFSARALNEILVIDHSTTTAEAAGHTGGNHGKGGDILYRWGNPQNYGAGGPEDQVFWGVHGANWIDPNTPGYGGIIAFNNGNRDGTDEDSSSVVEIMPPTENGLFVKDPGEPFGPAQPEWEYTEDQTFYSLRYGSAQRLPNGNTLICEGVEGNIFEVSPNGTKVWVFVEPIGNGVFGALRYWDMNPVPTTITSFNARAEGVSVKVSASFVLDLPEVTVELIRGSEGEPSRRVDMQALNGRERYEFVDRGVQSGNAYTYQLRVRDADGEVVSQPQRVVVAGVGMTLAQNYPNPFNPTTSISYSLPQRVDVTLAVFDSKGRLVRTLVSDAMPAGEHSVVWNGHDNAGRAVATGVYFYRLVAGNQNITRKMVLLK